MKEIRTTKLVEQTTIEFIANDGRKFIGDNAEQDCIVYERRLNQEIVKKEFNKVKHIIVELPLLNWFKDWTKILIVKLTDENDYMRLIDYLITFEDKFDCDIDIDTPTSYPQQYTIFLDENYCGLYEQDLMTQFINAYNTIDNFKKVVENNVY